MAHDDGNQSLDFGIPVIDIRMPGNSSFRLQGQLDQRNCARPVIVISGHGDTEACRHAFKYGAPVGGIGVGGAFGTILMRCTLVRASKQLVENNA